MDDRFSYNLEEDDNKRIWYLTWVNNPIPVNMYNNIYHKLNHSNNYSYANMKIKRIFNNMLVAMNRHNNSNMTMNQFMAMRNIILKQKTITNFNYLHDITFSAAYDYNHGLDIINISRKYDFPPSILLFEIFIINGYDKHYLNHIFKSNIKVEFILNNDFDTKQYIIVRDNDFDSKYHQALMTDISFKNEMIIVKFFKDLGINCMTENDLLKEQTETHGRAIITPDLLFIDTVYINGVVIKWLDFKNYPCLNNNFLFRSNKKQAEKYTLQWGLGAMCYNYSFVDGVKIPNAMILDATALELDFIKN